MRRSLCNTYGFCTLYAMIGTKNVVWISRAKQNWQTRRETFPLALSEVESQQCWAGLQRARFR